MKTTTLQSVFDEWHRVQEKLEEYNRSSQFYLDHHFDSFVNSFNGTVGYDGFSCKNFSTAIATYYIDNCSSHYYKLSQKVQVVVHATVGEGSRLIYHHHDGKAVGDKVFQYMTVSDILSEVSNNTREKCWLEYHQYPGRTYWEYNLDEIIVRERHLPTSGKFQISCETGRSIIDGNLGVYDTWDEAYAAARKEVEIMDDSLREHQRNCGIPQGLSHNKRESLDITGEVYCIEFRTYYYNDSWQAIYLRKIED